jgi:F-type H+-transporting ATPase subunit delta
MARIRTTTARRYAEAGYQLAERDGTVEEWMAQLELAGTIARDPAVVRRLEDPAVPFDVRRAALLDAMGGDLLPPVGNLLALLLRRRRIEQLTRIGREFRRIYNQRHDITAATVVSAAELESDEVDALRQRVERLAGGSVELELQVDPSLLGGVQLRLGDRLIDGSVRGRLERLRHDLTARA